MADPTIQTFCCHKDHDYSRSSDFLSEFNSKSYNIVCLVSSCIGILGALYQILPRENVVLSQRWFSVSSIRGRKIIVWLAIADLSASLGVFFRSLFWLNYKNLLSTFDHDTTTILCALSSAWIQYFYTATWLWTMVYAIDMRLVLKERGGHPTGYHCFVWTVPALLTALGLSILYIPNANCHNVHSMSSALMRILPNYFIGYLPMALVMIVNPLLYACLSKDIEVLVAGSFAQFTDRERHIVDLIRIKFSMINIVFYICWLPNLINGVLIWTLWFDLPQEVLITLWYVMASVNPLQALFNSVVYRRWSPGVERVHLPCRKVSSSSKTRSSATTTSINLKTSSELTPLISSSINGSSASDEEVEHHSAL